MAGSKKERRNPINELATSRLHLEITEPIYQALEDAGKDMRWLAKESGVPLQLLNAMMLGYAPFTVARIAALTDVLGCEATISIVRRKEQDEGSLDSRAPAAQ